MLQASCPTVACHARPSHATPGAARALRGESRAQARSSRALRGASRAGPHCRAPGPHCHAPGPILWPSMRPGTCMADADRLRALDCPTARSAGADPTPEPGRSTARPALQVLGRISGRPPKVRDQIADRRLGQLAPKDALTPRAWREDEAAPGVQRSGPSSTATPMVSSRRPELVAISAMVASKASLLRAEGVR